MYIKYIMKNRLVTTNDANDSYANDDKTKLCFIKMVALQTSMQIICSSLLHLEVASR